MDIAKIKLPVDYLKIGMYVSALDRPWIETPFIFQGFLITNEGELDQLQQYCKYVYVDRGKSRVKIPEANVLITEQAKMEPPVVKFREPLPYQGQFEEEFPRAKKIFEQVQTQLKNSFRDVRIGRGLRSSDIRQSVENIMKSIIRNPDAMMLMTNMKAMDEYLVTHSMNVCILCLIFARFLGLEEDTMRKLGMGALLHDVGEIRLPKELLDKPSELNAEEHATVEKHTEYGASILKENNGIPKEAIDIAMHHHERLDRSGYPKKLGGQEISRNAKIVGIVDIYDALTSARPYRTYMSSTDALKSMYDWRGSLFDTTLVEKFIQCVGIYPVGSTLELNSGEIGIVISASPENRLYPKMLLVKEQRNKFYELPRIINLSQFKDREDNLYDIKGIVQPEQVGVDLKRYILRELVAQIA
ncbi:MAG: HD-GYP domain-containing protein [Gammaproteobacteria bacterium]